MTFNINFTPIYIRKKLIAIICQIKFTSKEVSLLVRQVFVKENYFTHKNTKMVYCIFICRLNGSVIVCEPPHCRTVA